MVNFLKRFPRGWKVFMRKVFGQNEYNVVDEWWRLWRQYWWWRGLGWQCSWATAARCCPRDRRFTPLLGAEKELFALLLLDSLDTLCFLLIFYWIYFRKAFEEEKISSILQWYSHFYSIIHSNILVHYQNISIFFLSLSSVLFLYRKLPILEDMLQSLFSVMALLLWSP